MAFETIFFMDDVSFLDTESLQQVDCEHGACMNNLIAKIQTFRMEFDAHNPRGKLPGSFVREFGATIGTNVILRDHNYNEVEVHVVRKKNKLYFEEGWLTLRDIYNIWFSVWITFSYINPRLLTISLATRWGNHVKYPSNNPPIRCLLDKAGGGHRLASFPSDASVNMHIPQRSFLRTVVKKLTVYDVQSGTLVLPWTRFGKLDTLTPSSDLWLVDYTGAKYSCKSKFSINATCELYSKISGDWANLCTTHGLNEGSSVIFTLPKSCNNNVMYVFVDPRIGIETTLSYPLGDGTELPLFVSQNYVVINN